ncbi:MAG: cysteine hydrolase [Pseudomonadota bacterium]|nr:cysteine hydrolase [Pseudomonadota bacterium]
MTGNDLTPEERRNRGTYLAKDEMPGYPRDKTAILIIDPVNDFLSEGGAAWELTKATVEHNDVVKHLRELIDGAHERGIPLLFGPMAFTEEDYAEHALQKRSGINRIMYEKKMFLAGTWGADFHPDLQPSAGDIILEPHKTTDVFMSDLPEQLEGLGITHLVIAGMAANLCCESTGRHAVERGFDVTYLSDAIGSESMPSYEAAIRLNYPLLGNAVITVEEFYRAFDGLETVGIIVHEGDVVRGSDHGEIGAVQEVLAATGENDACLLVPQGLIFTSDNYIPMEAVVQRSGRDVYVNLPKLVASKMPWDKPPTVADRAAKNGPPAASVDKLYRTYEPTGGASESRRDPTSDPALGRR